MGRIYNQISKVVNKIFKEEYVTSLYIRRVGINSSESPHEKLKTSRQELEAIEIKGFFTVETSDLINLNFGKKQGETGTCFVRIEELKTKGLWDYDKNIPSITTGLDKIEFQNKEYIIETVNNIILLDNKYLFCEIKFNLMSYEK